MSAKSKVEAGFQLVAKDFHTGGMIVDAMIDKIVAAINSLDINKDGVSDIAEFAPLVLKVFPKLATLWSLVHTDTLAQLIASSPVFNQVDNAKVQAAMADIVAAVNAAEAAIPAAPSTPAK